MDLIIAAGAPPFMLLGYDGEAKTIPTTPRHSVKLIDAPILSAEAVVTISRAAFSAQAAARTAVPGAAGWTSG